VFDKSQEPLEKSPEKITDIKSLKGSGTVKILIVF
jgi:hypothetical protein